MTRISDLDSITSPPLTNVMVVSDGEITKKITLENAKNIFLTQASKTELGGIKVGPGLDISDTGVLSVKNYSAYVLPPATANILGGIRVGAGLKIDGTSVLSLDYSIPLATANTLGGVKVGTGLTVNNGVISVIPVDYTRYPDTGLTVGIDDDLKVFVDQNVPTIQETKNGILKLTVYDSYKPNQRSDLIFVNSTGSDAYGGDTIPTFSPSLSTGQMALGSPNSKWHKIYSDVIYSDVVGDVTGNLTGSHQGNLRAADGTLAYSAQSKVFNGNFIGELTGNSTTATRLLNSVTINGVLFNGSTSIVVSDNTKLPLSGGILTGLLTLSGDPNEVKHAATKGYVDNLVSSMVSLSGGTMKGYLSLYSNPTLPDHAATKKYVDELLNTSGVISGASLTSYIDQQDNTRLPIAGGTMTGFLTLSGNPTSNLHAATKQYVDSSFNNLTSNLTSYINAEDSKKLPLTGGTLSGGLILSGDPVSPSQATTKSYVDTVVSRKVPLTGGTMTGYLTLSGEPVEVNHAATKGYVDSQLFNGVPLTGGTMTGLLTLSGNPTSNLHAATKQYVDSEINLKTSTLNSSLTSYIDSKDALRLLISGGTMTGFLTLSGNPTNPLHAATKNYVDNIFSNIELPSGDPTKVPLIGGTMTGLLTLSGNPTSNLHAATKQYVDSGDAAILTSSQSYTDSRINTRVAVSGGTMTGFLTLSGNPTSNLHAATKQYVDTSISNINIPSGDPTKVPLTGGAMTGFLTLSGNPTSNLHAATKQYVDTSISAASDSLTTYIDNKVKVKLSITGGTMSGVLTLNADPVGSLDAATKQYVDTSISNLSVSGKVSKSGDSMSGFLTLNANPTSNLHAATKQYVDTSISNLSVSGKVSKSGDSMSGPLILAGAPTNGLHAATKSYVDSTALVAENNAKAFVPTFTSGSSYTVNFTNQQASFSDSNYFDVYPPSSKSMSSLLAFIPSINQIYFDGNVDQNDAIRCEFSVLSDRIRVFVQGTEQRALPAANWLAVWR